MCLFPKHFRGDDVILMPFAEYEETVLSFILTGVVGCSAEDGFGVEGRCKESVSVDKLLCRGEG